MSSPVHNDIDRRVMYAPPWAREMPEQPPEAIVAAIDRLRQERLRSAPPSPWDEELDAQPRHDQLEPGQHELPLAGHSGSIDIETAMAQAVRATWTPSSLDPVTMPEPPKPRLDGPTWGMVVRLCTAVGFAAAIALFVTGAIPLPSVDISPNSGEGAKAASMVVRAIGLGDTRTPKMPASVAVADTSPSMTLPPIPVVSAGVPPPNAQQPDAQQPKASASGALPTEVLSAFASLDTSSAAVVSAPLMSKGDGGPALVAATAQKLPDLRALERDELASLIRRGQALLAEGDISSARLLLLRAAEAGDATAALTLGGSYDGAELAKLKVIGVAPDHAQAKVWYAKAVEHGSAEAVRRLQQLARRAD